MNLTDNEQWRDWMSWIFEFPVTPVRFFLDLKPKFGILGKMHLWSTLLLSNLPALSSVTLTQTAEGSKTCYTGSCRLSPVRLRGLRGSRGWSRGDEGGACWAAGRLGERGNEWATGRPGESGPIRVRVWATCLASGLVGDGAGDVSSCGVLEREETLQDLRRGNDSVGWARPWERVLGMSCLIWNIKMIDY